jgi:hypothetical protein
MAVQVNRPEGLTLSVLRQLFADKECARSNKLHKPRAGEVYVCNDDKEGKSCFNDGIQ